MRPAAVVGCRPARRGAAERAERRAGTWTATEMNAYERHKALMLDWQKYYGGRLLAPQQTAKSDADVLREQYRFIRAPEDDADESWEARLAKRYYAKLFREYAVADLSRHQARAGCLAGPLTPAAAARLTPAGAGGPHRPALAHRGGGDRRRRAV